MSNDRELLELAAKAAGIEIAKWSEHANVPICTNGRFFDPLKDDGDAFRLAVKLSIGTCFADGVVTSMMIGLPRDSETPVLGAPVSLAGDPCAATRRAIVRAAAAMAKTTA